MVTREILEGMLIEISKEEELLLANLNKLVGAKEAVQHLLEVANDAE